MIKLVIKTALVIFLVLLVNCALANSPVSMLNQTAQEMLNSLAKNKSQLSRSKTIIPQIVQRTLIPHVDLNRMAGSVVGREHWSNASAAQKQAFINEFTRLVISTYSAALASYNDDRVQFYPLRGDVSANTITVNSLIVRKTGQRIPISYNLDRVGGEWKVYDFNIEDISMVQSYRSQFSDTLAQKGLEGLIQKLKVHNARRS